MMVHTLAKELKRIGNVFVSRVNLTNFWKIFPKFDIPKLKNKTMVTSSSQGLQNLVHVIFQKVEMMEINLKIMNFDYFSNQNKYIFRKKK
jgi:hypothetical protein